MAMLEIDGVGKVEVGDGFLSMSPQQQAAEVDFIAQSLKPAAPVAAAPVAGAERFANPDPEMGFGAVRDIKEGAAKVAQGLSSERIQQGASSVIPMAPLDIATGLFQMAMAPASAAGRAFGQAVEKASGGMITAQQAETALMALAPAKGGSLNLKSGAVPEAAAVAPAAAVEAPGVVARPSAIEEVLQRPDGSPAPAAAEAAPATPGKTLVEDKQAIRGEMQKVYKILNEKGEDVGGAIFTMMGSTAKLENVSVEQLRNSLGPSGVRSLMRQFQEANPQVKELVADRISGARNGGKEVYDGESVTIKLPPLKKVEASAAVEAAPGAAKPIAEAPSVAAPPVPASVSPANAAEFRAASQAFYKKSEDAGLLINPKSLETSVKELATELKKGGLDPQLHADATQALKRLAEARTEPVSLQQMDTLRQIAQDAAASPKAGERRLAGLIKDKIDDFVLGLTDKDVISAVGKPEDAVKALTTGRELWSKGAKLDRVAELVDRAQTSASGFTGSGFENALRTEFRALAKNARQLRTFTPEEQAAIKKVARGGAAENAARNVGKLAPTGVVSATLGGGAGAVIGTAIGIGPVAGAATFGGLGFAGRRLATVLTKRNVAALEKAIISGGAPATAVASLQRSRALLAALEGAAKATSAAETTKGARGK